MQVMVKNNGEQRNGRGRVVGGVAAGVAVEHVW